MDKRDGNTDNKTWNGLKRCFEDKTEQNWVNQSKSRDRYTALFLDAWLTKLNGWWSYALSDPYENSKDIAKVRSAC